MPQVNYWRPNMEIYEILCIICKELDISEYRFVRKCGLKSIGLRSLINREHGTITYKTYLRIKSYCDTVGVDVSVLKNFIKV
nr:MAG TPA: Regulatory protein [Caudoviricetes sp.]